MSKYTAKPNKPNKYAPLDRKDELTAYYNDVEEAVIVVFGTFEKAAKWFDAHEIALNSLWAYCETKFEDGWSAVRAANEWYHVNVAAQPITKTPVYTYVSYKSKPEIEPEILAAREVRGDTWGESYLVDL